MFHFVIIKTLAFCNNFLRYCVIKVAARGGETFFKNGTNFFPINPLIIWCNPIYTCTWLTQEWISGCLNFVLVSFWLKWVFTLSLKFFLKLIIKFSQLRYFFHLSWNFNYTLQSWIQKYVNHLRWSSLLK